MRMLKTYSSKHTRTNHVANGHNSHNAPADGDSVDVGEDRTDVDVTSDVKEADAENVILKAHRATVAI